MTTVAGLHGNMGRRGCTLVHSDSGTVFAFDLRVCVLTATTFNTTNKLWMPLFVFNASIICQQAEKRGGLRFPEALAAERHGGGEHHL